MKEKEINTWLASIDGLENGNFTNRPKIKERHFFTIGDGWLDIVKDLVNDLIKLGWNKEICQVKEKFGGLRFYANAMTDEMYNRVKVAEELASKTCEICGATENIGQTTGWIVTICESCFNKSKKENNIWANRKWEIK